MGTFQGRIQIIIIVRIKFHFRNDLHVCFCENTKTRNMCML